MVEKEDSVEKEDYSVEKEDSVSNMMLFEQKSTSFLKLIIDYQGGDEAPICVVCGKAACANMDMSPIVLSIWCQHWWNGDHSSLPVSE